ncbi:MAG: flagellar basal body rod protein FlgC [candidate division Zixibacteria bacterium]|nr:flagellar basal body rod protein FlgC [candidate division Zixibacteria bacterium]
MGGILNAIEIASKGLSVQRTKMNTVAKNIANAETTETEEGGPYRRQRVMVEETPVKQSFKSVMKDANSRLSKTNSKHMSSKIHNNQKNELSSVDVDVVSEDKDNFKVVYDPTHPQADEEGYVKMPNIEIITEMVDMMAASRAYEANTVAISSAKEMAKNALEI